MPFARSASGSASSATRDNNSSILAVTTDDKFDARHLESLRIALAKENETNSFIQVELNNTKVALFDATSRENDLKQTNNLLQDTIDTLRAENDVQRHDILQLTASAADKGAQIEQHCDKVKDLETQLATIADSNKTLTTEQSQMRHDLELSEGKNAEHESKIESLELRLADVTRQNAKDEEAAQMELKQTKMILHTKLEHAHERLKESEAREQKAHEAKSEAADEVTELMTKFKSEREGIREEMTKVGVRLRSDLPFVQCSLLHSYLHTLLCMDVFIAPQR